MYYEINVSLNGSHFFATNERSLRNQADMQKVYDKLKIAFPESEGYKLSVEKWETRGLIINML